MSNYLTQLYIHIVFAVKHRTPVIQQHWEDELYKYITGIVHRKGEKLLEINGVPDHIHMLIRLSGNVAVSDLVREIKKSSNAFIRNRRFCNVDFYWQEGYGAFSCSLTRVETLRAYIRNQKSHHSKLTFLDEFAGLLREYGIEYKEYQLRKI